jgi:hypothetical protein
MRRVTRELPIVVVAAGAVSLVVFAYLGGGESLVSTLTRIMWWQFGLVWPCTGSA